MSEKGRLLKNTGLIALGNFGAKMASFLLLPLYTSMLTTSEYGTYDYIVAMSAFLLPIVTLCMQEAMFRFIIDARNHTNDFNKIISNAFVIVISGIGLMAVTMVILGKILDFHNLFYVSCYVFANALYSFSNNLLRGLGKIKEYAAISSGKNILQLILNVITVAGFRWGMMGLMTAMCLSEYIAFVVVFCITRLWKYVSLKHISIKTIGLLIRYSFPLIPNALCGQIINLSDRLMISNIMGKHANGIYSISYKFPSIIETLSHFFYMAWSESASRVWNDGKDSAVEYYQSFHDMIEDMVFSVILMMIAGMPIMYRVFIHGDYIQGFAYTPILLLAMYFDSMSKFYSGVFTALKNTETIAISTVIAAASNLVINFIFIQKFGLFAAAGSTLVANVVLVLIQRHYVGKKLHINRKPKKWLTEMLFLVVIMALYSYSNWIKIIISIILATIYFVSANREILTRFVHLVIKKYKGNEV